MSEDEQYIQEIYSQIINLERVSQSRPNAIFMTRDIFDAIFRDQRFNSAAFCECRDGEFEYFVCGIQIRKVVGNNKIFVGYVKECEVLK